MTKTALLLLLAPALFAAVTVSFNPLDPETGPFPTDALTVPDDTQKTGRRVNLPLPDCSVQVSACQDLAQLNQLDGFNLQPRIRVRFSDAVDTNTLRNGIFFVALDNLTSEEFGLQHKGDRIAINQVIYDPDTNSVYAKPDEPFDQHRRYALVVTSAVRDRAGNPVSADPAFQACLQNAGQSDYCTTLAQAVSDAGVQGNAVVASVFTTLSATAWMEKARAAVQGAAPEVKRAGTFRISDITTLVWNQDVGSGNFAEFSLPLGDPALAALLGGLDRVVFGSFQSPRFLNDQQLIDPSPSGAEVPLPGSTNETFFQVYLPKSTKPAAGYPVVIFGHGFGDSRFGGPTIVAPTLANDGFATIAINVVGHGYGPNSTVTLNTRSGATTLPAPGRGVDLNGDGVIDTAEGCIVIQPSPVAARDCFRQTVLDLVQLAHAIRTGMDVDGDGTVDLDPDRIYYAGQSLGSLYGTMFTAIEPAVRAAALNVGGGSIVEIARWSQSYRDITADFWAARTPPLLPPGVPFNDNYVLRDQPVKINDVPGAMEIQNYMELLEWIQAPGDPIPYAPHLRSSTLPDVPIKPVLWQIAKGDRTVPNPASSNLIRGANMRESTWMYRHDLARAVAGDLPANPHVYLALFVGLANGSPALPSLRAVTIGLDAQQQISGFLKSDGAAIPNGNGLSRLFFGRDLFEVPAALPEDLNF